MKENKKEMVADPFAAVRDELQRLFAGEAHYRQQRERRIANPDCLLEYESDERSPSAPPVKLTRTSIIENGNGLVADAFEAAGFRVVKPGCSYGDATHPAFRRTGMTIAIKHGNQPETQLIASAVAVLPSLKIILRKPDAAEGQRHCVEVNTKQPDWAFRLRACLQFEAAALAAKTLG